MRSFLKKQIILFLVFACSMASLWGSKKFEAFSDEKIEFFYKTQIEGLKAFKGFACTRKEVSKVSVKGLKEKTDDFELIFVALYKTKVYKKRKVLDNTIANFADKVAKNIAWEKGGKAFDDEGKLDEDAETANVIVHFISLAYDEEPSGTAEDHESPGKTFARFMHEKILPNKDPKDHKLCIYAVSGSHKSVAYATGLKGEDVFGKKAKSKAFIFPKKSIYSIIGINPGVYRTGAGAMVTGALSFLTRGLSERLISQEYISPRFKAIKHRVYNFYVKAKDGRQKRKLEGFFDKSKNFSRLVNIRCMYSTNKGVVRNVPFGDLLFDGAHDAFAKIMPEVDSKYQIHNDLLSLIYKTETRDVRKDGGVLLIVKKKKEGKKFPLTIINRKIIRDGSVFKNEKEDWKIVPRAGKWSRAFKRFFEIEKFNDANTKRTIARMFRKSKNRGLADEVAEFKKIFKYAAGQYYTPEKAIIGAFFLPVYDRYQALAFVGKYYKKNLRFLVDGKVRKPASFVPLGRGDYFIVKWDISSEDFRKKYAIVSEGVVAPGKKEKKEEEEEEEEEEKKKSKKFVGKKVEVVKGVIPPMPGRGEPYSFVVSGDYRKHHRGETHFKGGKKAHESVALKTSKFLRGKNGLLQLMTGDVVFDGGTESEWLEWFEQIGLVIAKDKWLTSVVGNHDLSSHTKGGMGKYVWAFDDTIPNFGNIFNFTEKKEISVTDHIERTRNIFDVGCVRFIHLPLATEETKLHYMEQVGEEKYGTPGESLLRWFGVQRAGCYNFNKKIYEDFRRDLERAEADKARGQIRFIIVCCHAPLLTSVKYKMPHPGILNSMMEKWYKFRDRQKSQDKVADDIEKHLKKKEGDVPAQKFRFGYEVYKCLQEFAIDLCLSGHNHVFDRGFFIRGDRDWPRNLPMVTMGVGTDLKSVKLFKPSMTNKFINYFFKSSQTIFGKGKAREFPGFLKCDVSPKNGTISCKLYGPREFDGVVDDNKLKKRAGDEEDFRVYDEFTLKEVEFSEKKKRKRTDLSEKAEIVEKEEEGYVVIELKGEEKKTEPPKTMVDIEEEEESSEEEEEEGEASDYDPSDEDIKKIEEKEEKEKRRREW